MPGDFAPIAPVPIGGIRVLLHLVAWPSMMFVIRPSPSCSWCRVVMSVGCAAFSTGAVVTVPAGVNASARRTLSTKRLTISCKGGMGVTLLTFQRLSACALILTSHYIFQFIDDERLFSTFPLVGFMMLLAKLR